VNSECKREERYFKVNNAKACDTNAQYSDWWS
jgi:hypothetical protein